MNPLKIPFEPAQRVSLLVLLLGLGFVLSQVNWEIHSANTGSRFATIDALVHHHTSAINESRFSGTIDKVWNPQTNQYYSSKPPFLSWLGAGVYGLWDWLGGERLKHGSSGAVWFVTAVLGFGTYLGYLIYAHALCRLWFRHSSTQALTFLALALGNLVPLYATTLNNHSFAAFLTLAGLYWAQRAAHSTMRLHAFWCGLHLGLLPLVDLPSLSFSVLLGLWVMTKAPRAVYRHMLAPMAAAVPLFFLLNLASTGTVWPSYLFRYLEGDHTLTYFFPGAPWTDSQNRVPVALRAFHFLVGYKGMIPMVPLAVVGVWGLLSAPSSYRSLARVVGAVGLLQFGFYLVSPRELGGECVGFRWFIPFTSLLILWSGFVLEKRRSWVSSFAFALLILVPVYHSIQNPNPWKKSVWERNFDERFGRL